MELSAYKRNPVSVLAPEPVPNAEFFARIRELSALGYAPLFYFGVRDLICGMGKASCGVEILRSPFPASLEYPALTVDIPAFHIFERELWEECGLTPLGHPWLKPLRYPAGGRFQVKEHPFFSSQSPALHEVGVGPVHAGVIEPGHFRFICQGETVEHLEIQLGYQHRGIAKLLADGDISSQIQLAEMIAGDTAVGHGLAYCLATEALCGVEISGASQTVRLIALELERVAMHLADLSALSGDIAYLSGLNLFAALRTTVINASLALCGSRFGKRWLCPGGINYGISAAQNSTLRETLSAVGTQEELCAAALLSDAGVLNRFDSTGSLSLETVKELNMSGITAKAAGYAIDARVDFPYGGYENLIVKDRQNELASHGIRALTLDSGDVFARASLRHLDIMQSLDMIQFMLSTLPSVEARVTELPAPRANQLAISIVEGWRGRIVHVIGTDQAGQTSFYKVYDPSLHNWFGLALAVRDGGISDFPLCNKSFDLSYCGADL